MSLEQSPKSEIKEGEPHRLSWQEIRDLVDKADHIVKWQGAHCYNARGEVVARVVYYSAGPYHYYIRDQFAEKVDPETFEGFIQSQTEFSDEQAAQLACNQELQRDGF